MNLQGFRAVDLRGNAVFCPHQSLKWNTCRRQAVQYMCAGNTAPVWPQWYMTSAWCTGRKAVRNRATWCSELMMDSIQQAFTGRAARIRPRKESVEQQVGLLQHGAVWSQVRSLQGSENTHKNMVKSERSAKSSNAKWTFYLCVYVYWLYLNLTFRRVEENRSVRGTTSSYRHCSSTCKTSCIETHTFLKTVRKILWTNVDVSNLLCFPQNRLQEDEEVVGISGHEFLQTPAADTQTGWSDRREHNNLLSSPFRHQRDERRLLLNFHKDINNINIWKYRNMNIFIYTYMGILLHWSWRTRFPH